MHVAQGTTQFFPGFLHVGPEAVSRLRAKTINNSKQGGILFSSLQFLLGAVLFDFFAVFSRFPLQDERREDARRRVRL